MTTNILPLNISRAVRRAGLLLSLVFGMSLASCDDTIYDDEGDCDPRYKVSFRYDMNMKWADAFPHEVEAVTLYLIDAGGNVVWQRTDDGEPLTHEGYTMDVDVAPGTYSLLAWAGDTDQHSFDIGPAGRSSKTELTARLIREYDATGKPISKEPLSRLYHGYVADVEFPATEGDHVVATVNLTKDINYIKVVLQQVGGQPLDMNDMEVTITDDNGMMEWDNSLRPDEVITYRPAYVTPIAASISPDDPSGSGLGTANTYTGMMAEFTTARLMEEHRYDARLTVRNIATGQTIFSIDLIDYLLMVKGHYNQAMDDQEYLDRQDAYDLVFFLDENHTWLGTTIFINSWKVVRNNIDF